jgi:hypothetical protein
MWASQHPSRFISQECLMGAPTEWVDKLSNTTRMRSARGQWTSVSSRMQAASLKRRAVQ